MIITFFRYNFKIIICCNSNLLKKKKKHKNKEKYSISIVNKFCILI